MWKEIRDTRDVYHLKNNRVIGSLQTVTKYLFGIKVYYKRSYFVEDPAKENTNGIGFKNS